MTDIIGQNDPKRPRSMIEDSFHAGARMWLLFFGLHAEKLSPYRASVGGAGRQTDSSPPLHSRFIAQTSMHCL